MNRLSRLLIFILLLPGVAEAQTSTLLGAKTKQITFHGKIVDAETGDPLPFAQINHIYKIANSDSMIIRNFIADKNGLFEFLSPRAMNNRVEIIYLGYNILTRMLSEAGNQIRLPMTGTINLSQKALQQQPEIHNRIDLGILKLTPDVQQLDEVVVKARLDLFKRVGDTLYVFPKNIKQFEGDALIDLLKRHPSFYVNEQGDIYVDGEKIERAMINNKHVFGEEVRTMVHSIMAKEAGLIKVYDEIDEESEIERGEAFARKRRVMNVITFKDFNMFKGGEVQLEAGIYEDKDKNGKRQSMHDAHGRIGQYAEDFRIAVEGNTRKTAFPQKKQETGAGINAEVSSTDLLHVVGTDYNYEKNEQEQEGQTQQFYFPTSYFETQTANRENYSWQDKHTHRFMLTGKYIKKKDFSVTGTYRGSTGNTRGRSLAVSDLTKDGEQLSYLQQLGEKESREDKHNMSFKLTRSLNKSSGISLSLYGQLDRQSGEGSRVDSSFSAGKAEKQAFNTFTKNPYYHIDSDLSFNKNFDSPNFTSGVGYHPSISYKQWNPLYRAVNQLTGEIDSTTTRDQTRKDLKISNEVHYGGAWKNKGWQLLTRIGYDIYRLQLEEHFPGNLHVDKKFHTWNLWIDFAQDKFTLGFITSDNAISAAQLSNRLRDNDPMNLSTGNPNLKMGKKYTFICNIKLKEALRLKLIYDIITNPVLQARRYFETNTPLPEFDNYMALAGAMLTSPVNAKKYNSFHVEIRSNSTKGFMLLRGYIDYTFEDPETDLLGEIARSQTHRASGSLAMISNFSSTFRLDITNRTTFNHSRIKATEPQNNGWISNHATGKANLTLFYRMMVNADYTYSYHYNSRTGKTNNRQTLNASIDYRVFSSRRGVISVNAYNLLNSRSSLTTTSTDIYIQNTYRPENSTLVSLSFRYKFGVEQ